MPGRVEIREHPHVETNDRTRCTWTIAASHAEI